MISKMYDPKKRLDKGLAREGEGWRDGRPALIRISNMSDV